MESYDQLVKALRHCITRGNGCVTCEGCSMAGFGESCIECVNKLHTDAAAAIEELQAEVYTLKRTDSKRCQECLYLGQPAGEQQLPKRGDGCDICRNGTLEEGDTLYKSSDWDGGIGFDYIRDIRFCPICGRKLKVQE